MGLPVKPVFELIRIACLGFAIRHPEGSNVIVDFIVGRDFDQLNRAVMPVALRFDPQAGTAVITHTIQIVLHIAITLHQTKTTRVVITKCRCADGFRVIELSPDAFAAAGPKL